jgi:excisionase family DNA binding protein
MMDNTVKIKKLLNKKDVCELLSISIPTLDRMIARGEIAGVKIGKGWRMRPENLERWIDKKTA